MAILPIIIAPDPRLKAECDPVEKVTPELVKLMDDMLDTMYDAPGIGLAAPQVGRRQQIIVADVSKQEDVRDPYQMINPEILWTSKDVFSSEEGCLSLPEQYAGVMRPKQVRIRFLDKMGCPQIIEVEDLLAVCLQHEMDHLKGILFVDHISKLKRDLIMRKLRKMKKLEKKGK